MELDAGKRRHLVSAYAAVCHLLRQIDEAAREGRSPTGVGPPLTPLRAEDCDSVTAPLHELAAELRSVVARVAPAELRELESLQPQGNTAVWIANLLDHIRETVDGLRSSRMRKYGRLEARSATELDGLHERLARLISDCEGALHPLQESGSGDQAQ